MKQPVRKLERAVRMYQLILGAQSSLRWTNADRLYFAKRWHRLIEEIAKEVGMPRASVEQQVAREATRRPPLRKKHGRW